MAIFNSELLVYQRVPPMSMVHHYVAHSSMTIRRKPSPITLPLKSLHNLVDKTSKSKTISIFFTVPQLGLSYLQPGKLTSLTRQIQINEHYWLVSPRLHHFAVLFISPFYCLNPNFYCVNHHVSLEIPKVTA